MAEYYWSKGSWVKDCPKCEIQFRGGPNEDEAVKEISKYFASDKYTVDGFYGSCRECVARYNQSKRDGRVCDPEALLKAQDGKCGICEKPIDFKRVPYTKTTAYVDHDHNTNAVRGLLCHRCNSLLGVVEDKAWLTAALAYLEKHREDN